MADLNQNVKATITLAADIKGASEAVNAMKKVQKTLKDAGVQFNETGKFISLIPEKLLKGGQEFTRFSGAIDNGNKTVTKFSFLAKEVGNSLHVLKSDVSASTKPMKDFGEQSAFAGISIGKLAVRALATISVWQLLRSALQLVLSVIPAIVKHMIDFEAQLAQVAIVSENISKESLKNLGDESLKLASKFGTSFEQLGEALTIFAQQGFNANQILEVLGPTLEFALVSGRRLGDVVEDLVAIQTSFNLTSKDTARIYDIITAAQLKYSITTAQLSAGLRKLSPISASLGISLEQTTGLITALQEQTRQSGEASATAIESIFGRLQSQDTVASLQSLTKIPLFLKETGEATTEVTGRIRPTLEVLALLAQAYERVGEADRARLAVLLGGRTRFSEASALLQQYTRFLDVTTTAVFSFNATQKASAELMKTSKFGLQQLSNEAREFANELAPIAKFFVDLGIAGGRIAVGQAKLSLGLATGSLFNDALTGKSKNEEEFKKQQENLQKRDTLVKTISDSYLELIDAKKLFDEQEKNSKTSNELLDVQQARTKFNAEFTKQLNTLKTDQKLDFLPVFDPNTVESQLKEAVSKISPSTFNKIIQNQVLRQNNSEREEEFANRLKNVEVQMTEAGKSRIAIAREQLKILKEQGALTTKESQDLEKKLKTEIAEFDIKKRNLELEQSFNIELQKGLSMGENDLQIQQRKIAQARELFEITGDETKLLEEQLRLQELISEKIAQTSQELKSSVSESLKNLFNGDTDINGFFDSISNKVRDRINGAFANLITDKLFQTTGVGNVFGSFITQIENAFNGGLNQKENKDEAGSQLYQNAILTASQQGSQLYSQAILSASQQSSSVGGTTGASTASGFGLNARLLSQVVARKNDPKLPGLLQGVRDNGSLINTTGNQGESGGILSALTSKIGGFFQGNQGAANIGNIGFGAFSAINAIGQFRQGNTAGGIGGLLSTAGSIASLFPGYGTIIGAGLQVAGGLVSLFKKPKRTTTVQEETKETQVSSRIDVTNKKLDVVNRNLVALKQSFDTFVLPESAFFGEKRNLEDEFSINSRRGLA